ncbi:hypothetical protein COHA_004910, partial [Chlorella ohadii]
MADSSSDSELDLLDDLQGLQAELAALRAELGDDYVTYQAGDEESDAEEGGPSGLPGAALASLPATATEPTQPSSERQAEEATEARGKGRRAVARPAAAEQSEEEEEEEEEDDEEEEDEEEEEEEEEAGEAEEEEEEEDEQLAAEQQAAAARAEEEEEHEQAAQMIAAALGPSQRRSSRTALYSQQTAQPPAAAKQQEQQAGKPPAKQQRQRKSGQAAAPAAGGRRGRGKKGTAAEQAPAAKSSATAAAAAAKRAPPPPVSKLQAVREALEANRGLQARLHRLLASTNRAIDCNANILLRVRALAAKKSAPPAVATVPLTSEAAQLQAPVGGSWFWGGGPVAGGAGAGELPPNPDAQELRPLYQRLPFSFRNSRWSDEEQQKLRDGVVQLVQEYEANKQRLAALTLQSPVVAQLAAGFRDEEWAVLVQRQRLQRSTTECRLQWANAMAPTLSQRPWTPEEDAVLRQLAEKYQQRQWEAVSRELAAASAAAATAVGAVASAGGGHVRPPLACLQRYQQLLAVAGREPPKFESTDEGIARLAPLVAKHGSTWKRIAEEYNAAYGGGWDPDQLMHIWRRHAQRGPQARKGKWTEEEDETLRRDAQFEVPEDTYQATFETEAEGWTNVFIPWHEFVLVKRARSVPGAPPLDPAHIRQFGLVLSRFEFNGFANPAYRPGPFELRIEGGIRAYRNPRPQLIMVSSAGVERNAKIGLDEEARKKDIPIVQLNPGAVLHLKYTGENAAPAVLTHN